MSRDVVAEYKAYRQAQQAAQGALYEQQKADEESNPDRTTTQARYQAVQEIGGPITIPEDSGYTPEQHRVLTGSVYDPAYPKMDEDLDIDRNAGIRRLYQKLGHIPADFRWGKADDIDWEDFPDDVQPDSELQPSVKRRTQPQYGAIRWRPEDEQRVQRGVAAGELVAERFEVAPAKGYQWATSPQAGQPLPKVERSRDLEVERGVARPEMFDYEPQGVDIPTLLSKTFDWNQIGNQIPVLQEAFDQFTLSRNQDALRALNESRALAKKPAQIAPIDFEYKFDDMGRGWYESKDPEIQEALDDPIIGQQLEGSPGIPGRSWQYLKDINDEVDRLNALGFHSAARRESYERFIPVISEIGWDLLELSIWTLDALPIPSRIDPFPILQQIMPTDQERESFKNLRLKTWDNLTPEAKEKAATDPEYFIRMMYNQREADIRFEVSSGHITEYLEQLVNSMPTEFPVSDPVSWAEKLGPGEPYEEDPAKIVEGRDRGIEINWRPGAGLDIAEYRRGRVDHLMRNWFNQYLEFDDAGTPDDTRDDKTFLVWNGERIPVKNVTWKHMMAQLSEESQWQVHADVSRRLAAETSFLIHQGALKAQELAEKTAWREGEGFKAVGTGFSFFDDDYMRTTNEIAKGLNPYNDDAPWIKDIPLLGKHLEGPYRVARAATARRPGMFLKYYPSAQAWRPGRDGPTQWEIRHRTGLDWLMGWVGTTWEAGMLEPMIDKLRQNESDAGDLVYRYMRSLTDSPYEYTLVDDEGKEESYRLLAMDTPNHEWFNDIVDGQIAITDERRLAEHLGDIPWGAERESTLRKVLRGIEPKGIHRPFVGYRQFNKDTGKIELITKKEVLDDFVKVLEETYNATLGPEMSPEDRVRQVESIRQHKFLAHEMGAVWAELADALEVDQETKNAMVIGGSIVTGFGQEFANPIDPILAGMRLTGKGLKYAKRTKQWKRETRPAYLDQVSDELRKELDDELAKIKDHVYTNREDRIKDEAVIFDMINTRAHERGMKIDHVAQLIVEARIAHQEGYRHSISWSLDKARANTLKSEQKARALMGEWGYQEPRWILSGGDYATPTDRAFRSEDYLRGVVKYNPRQSKQYSIENPAQPGLLEAGLRPAEARIQAKGMVSDDIQRFSKEVAEDTQDLDVYVVFRTEDYIKENFSTEVWEIAKRDQSISLDLQPGDTSKLYPVYLGRLETDVVGQAVRNPTRSSWADKVGQSSRADDARWAPINPIRDAEDSRKVTQWKLAEVEDQPTLGLVPTSKARSYTSDFVFGGRFQGTNSLPSPNKNIYGRTFDPRTKEGALPQWRNPLTREWESPTTQGLKEAGQLKQYERWIDIRIEIERNVEEGLKLAHAKASHEANEWFSVRGSFARKFQAVSDELDILEKDLKQVNGELAKVVSQIEPSVIALNGLSLKRGDINRRIAEVLEKIKITSKPLRGKGKKRFKRGTVRGDRIRSELTGYQSDLASLRGDLAVVEASQAEIFANRNFRNLESKRRELTARQIELGARQTIAMDEMLKVDELFASLPRATPITTVKGAAELEMSIGKGLRATESRTLQQLRAQQKHRRRYEHAARKSSPKKREAAFRAAEEAANASKQRLYSMLDAYKEVAEDLRKGLEAVDSMPKDTGRFVNILEESGAISETKSPDPVTWFRSKILRSITAYNDDGSRAVDVDKLMDYLRNSWGDRAVDYITESIIGGPKQLHQAKIDGRTLQASELKKMSDTYEQTVEKIKKVNEEMVEWRRSDEYRTSTEAEKRRQLDLYVEKLTDLNQIKAQNEVVQATVIGTRGGQAGDVLHRIKAAQEKGIKTVDLSLEEIENFQHINNGLRHAYRETHEARRGLSYLEAMDQADQDVFGSLILRSTYYLKPLKERNKLNFYIFPSILQKALYHKDVVSYISYIAKRYMRIFNPISARIGEVSKDVENVFRASENLRDHVHTEMYEYLRMMDRAHKGMSPSVREEIYFDGVVEMMSKTEADEPLSIAYKSPLKSAKVWMHSGGAVHPQARQSVVNNLSLQDDLSIIKEQMELLRFIETEAKRLNPVGNVESLKNSITKAFETGKFKNMPNGKSVLQYIINQIDLWKTPPQGQKRSIDTLIGSYSEGTRGIRDISKIKATGDEAIKQMDDILRESEPITLNRLLATRWNMGDYDNWFARAKNFRESNIVLSWSRAFIPHGHAPSPSRAAYYYARTLRLFHDPRSTDFKWLLEQVQKMHMRDFGPETNKTRAYAIAALASIDGMVIFRTNRLMERAIGGFLTPDQVRSGNAWLQQTENSIKGWDAALDANIRAGRPIKQDRIRTGDKKKLTDYVLSGMDESGRGFWTSRPISEAADEVTERIVKETAMQYSKARTPEEAFRTGAQWSVGRLWRTSIVTGLVVPQPRYFYNNYWGDFSQIWLTEGLYRAGKINFQLMTDIPWWSDKLDNYQRRITEWVHKKNPNAPVLGSTFNALMNPWANRVWRGEKGYLRLPDGRLKSFDSIRMDLVNSGVLDTQANHDLLSSMARVTPHSWKEVPGIGSPFRKSEEYLDKYYRGQAPGITGEMKALGAMGVTGLGRGLQATTDIATDWRQNISWWATYVQQRQRGNFYMEMLRLGYTEKEAIRRTFNALYDWRNGITEYEIKWLAKYVPFYRFWRLALSQMGRELSQPLLRPSEKMVDLHMLGMKARIPGEYVGQSGLGRVRQQHVFREMLPYWTEPEMWEELAQDEQQLIRYAHALRPEWLYSRPTWGWKVLPEDQRKFYMENRGRALGYSVNALGPFTALDTAEFFMSTNKAWMGLLLKAMPGDTMNSHIAPDFEENFFRNSLDMLMPIQKEMAQQFLMDNGFDAGGHHKGPVTRLRPGEATMANSPTFGIEAWLDPDLGTPVAQRGAVALYRMLPVVGTELPGLMNAAWSDNYRMQKFTRDYLNSAKTPDSKDFIRGLQFAFGRLGGFAQQYPIDPHQRLRHMAADKQKAFNKASQKIGRPDLISDQPYPYPYNWRLDQPMEEQEPEDEDK